MYLLLALAIAIFIAVSTTPQVAWAEGGSGSGSDDFYTYFVSNRLFYDLTREDSSHPDENIIKGWLLQLQVAIQGCASLTYTARLGKLLVNRANLLRWKIKNIKGTIRRQQYLQQLWSLCVLTNEHIRASVDQQDQEQTNVGTTKRKRTAKHYSKRHQQRIKRQRITDCTNALEWLKQDGLTPVQVIVVNEDTKTTEKISLDHDLDFAFDLHGEQVDRNDQNQISMMLYVKDKFNISGRAYHEIASICKQMPRHYKLKQKVAELNSLWNLDSLNMLKRYETQLKSLGIAGFSFWIGKESKKLKCRTLTGPEKILLFQKINVSDVFPEVEKIQEVQLLWKDLLDINRLLSVRPEKMKQADAKTFEERSKQFVANFTSIYPSRHVTPYMHCMMMHVSQFMEVHGALLQFTQQGLEKYNDTMTKDYFRSSSHKGEECLQQILQKQNRLEHLENAGAAREIIHHKVCSNCKHKGHNRLSCTKPCNQCSYPSYRGHLVPTVGNLVEPTCQTEST